MSSGVMLARNFNAVIFSDSQTRAIDFCTWLSGEANHYEEEIDCEVYHFTYKNYFFTLFPSSELKSLSDVCLFPDGFVLLADNEKEIINLLDDPKFTPTHKFLFKSNNFKCLTRSNEFTRIEKLNISSNESPDPVLNYFMEADEDFRKTVKKVFDRYDDDRSGFIEINEINQIAKQLGNETKKTEFKKAIMALDINHDNQISFEEFLQWWKLKTDADFLIHINDLNSRANQILFEYFNFINLRKEMRNADDAQVKAGFKKIEFKDKIFDNKYIKKRINLAVSIGEKERLEGAKNYLSKFSDNLSEAKDDWVSVGVFIKADSISGEETANLLNLFKDKLVKFVDDNFLPISQLFKFDVEIFDYSANLIIKVRKEITYLLASSLDNFILIKEFFKGRFSQKFSGIDLEFNTTNEFDNVDISGYLNQTKLKILLQNVIENQKSKFVFLEPLSKCNFQDSELETFKLFLKSGLHSLTNFIKENLHPVLLNSLTRIEFTLNLFDVFTNLQIYSSTFI